MIDLKKYKVLFLDRDGVINVERKNDYAKNISEFVFETNVCKAISILARKFDKIFIVTNQRGVGRGVMTEKDLSSVHTYMLDEIRKEDGDITQIYTCFDINADSINRKPNIGMGFKALEEYPDVDFSASVLVGNSQSDIDFGNKLGMYTVLVGEKYEPEDKIHKNICSYFPNLYQFALSL